MVRQIRASSSSDLREGNNNISGSGQALRVGDRIPGFRTSAAFLTSLSANLRLSDDDMSSVTSSPAFPPTTSSTLPPPSPLAGATNPSSSEQPPDNNPLANVPSLTTYLTTSSSEKISALKLVADSVAQQRQTASRALIFHPLALGALGLVLAIVAQILLNRPRGHVALVATTWAGITMAALLSVRWATGGYIEAAEGINWKWLCDDEGREDEVLVTRFGEEVIGCVILRFVAEGGKGRRKRVARGVIRGWAVRLRYRGKGVGLGLLEETVGVVRERGAEGVEFAADHANSKRILPSLFNGGFDRRDRKARRKLEELVDAQGLSKKR
ncbi:MAG: hypothetical protein M1812_001920 [Candelaria pacifica]|nr:MAG: hypothetical protein M1812_001920 [Candelaria pacifica]